MSPAAPAPLRVLIVEDSVANRKLLQLLLASQNCDIAIAINGEDGVAQFAAQPFDVVLMDVQMPIMDGLTATRMIRHHEIGTGKRALIVAVTAGVDRERCLQAGMDDHIQKPVRPQVLQAMLQRRRSPGSPVELDEQVVSDSSSVNGV